MVFLVSTVSFSLPPFSPLAKIYVFEYLYCRKPHEYLYRSLGGLKYLSVAVVNYVISLSLSHWKIISRWKLDVLILLYRFIPIKFWLRCT